MSASIYERFPEERPSASPPSSRRRTAYRQAVYGDRESSLEHQRHRTHSKKKRSMMGFVFASLFVVAGILVITVVIKSMNAVDSGFGNFEMQHKESPLLPHK